MFFWNRYPYLDTHELNLDWALEEIQKIRQELEGLADVVYQRVMDEVQPQIDEQNRKLNELISNFEAFKTEIRNSQLAFERQINDEIASLERDFQTLQDSISVRLEEVKLYSDIQNDNLYNKIMDDISRGIVNLKVINYITGEKVTIQDMFDYLCMFHLDNPITYTQLALKAIDYTSFAGLNITWTDVVKDGNILIP